jgi:hypothetical protein
MFLFASSCHKPLHLRGRRYTSDPVQSAVLSCNLSFVYRFEGGISLLVGLTVLFLGATVALVVRCRHTLASGFFDRDSEYRTLYDASESRVSMNRVDANDGDVDDVDELSPAEDGPEADDDDTAADTADTTLVVTRPLVVRSARGSAARSAKKRNKTVDV